ncbi:MAG: ATP synthase F0 subunit B [Myxococcota bacterium]
MKRAAASAGVFAAVLLAAQLALAAGGGHHVELHPEINWWSWDMESPPVGWFLLNFVAFVFLLARLAGPGIRKGLVARSERIRDSVETNERELEAAREERVKWENRLAAVDEEAKELVANSVSDGEREKEKIVNAAKGYAERLRSDTSTIMEQEAASAQRELQREVSLQALDKAEAVLRASIDEADQKRLFEQAVVQLADGGTTRMTDAHEALGVGGVP